MSQTEVALNSFKWIDYTNPETDLLVRIADDLKLEKKVLLNCLDSDYLPHVEYYGGTRFLILRLMEPGSKPDADSVQELTTKIAIFLAESSVVTIHRLPLKEVVAVTEKVEAGHTDMTKSRFISLLYEQVSLGFDEPLTELETKLVYLEETLFTRKKSKHFLQEGFYLKRKASAFKNVLKLTLELLAKLIAQGDFQPEHFQQSKERMDRSLFYAEDVYENVQSLLNLHMAIESQKTNEASFRTNEIMRVLTVLTIVFLPLNFVAGVFGMNFQNLPLLSNPAGFWLSVLIMMTVTLVLGFYLYRQGWLRRPKIRAETELLEK